MRCSIARSSSPTPEKSRRRSFLQRLSLSFSFRLLGGTPGRVERFRLQLALAEGVEGAPRHRSTLESQVFLAAPYRSPRRPVL